MQVFSEIFKKVCGVQESAQARLLGCVMTSAKYQPSLRCTAAEAGKMKAKCTGCAGHYAKQSKKQAALTQTAVIRKVSYASALALSLW